MPGPVNFRLALVLGGAKSGKSRLAQELAERHPPPLLYVATGEAGDPEMAARIARHREARGPAWETWEVPRELPEALGRLAPRFGAVLVDCLTLWLSNLLLANLPEGELEAAQERLLDAARKVACPLILVSNEVGSGIVPDNPLARRFRDLAGRLHQRLAAQADLVLLCVAGLPVVLKPSSQGLP
ncbi:MAG: bifunctional adenosylcobinamide kinase/adenosylcobinamide-phosphate guanylyltransferase [Syntrophobacterales bacterium]|nr:bifunctional adenosylcobinamide kinase/adenosylcobinamide-phosphate guanylyltransferase [Syntrophobacterales bacterium]